MKFVRGGPPSTYVGDASRVEAAIRECRDYDGGLGTDTETLGKGYSNFTDEVLVVGLSPNERSRFFVPRSHLHHFKEVLEDEDIPKMLSNVKFDAHRLENAGIKLRGTWIDTVFLDFLFDEDTRENRHGLKECAWDHLGIPMQDFKVLFGKVKHQDIVPGHDLWERWVDYSTLDPWATRKLAIHLMNELAKKRKWHDDDETLLDHYLNVEEPQLQTLYRMERRGIRIDVPYLEGLGKEFEEEMKAQAAELSRLAGRPINPGSNQQLAELFFEDLGLEVIKRTNAGAPSVDASVRDYYVARGVEHAKIVNAYKKVEKYRGTYSQGLLKRLHTDGKIHTTYNATMVTGRLSSSNPNLQNIPSREEAGQRIRRAFIADEGKVLVGADYSQLEFRVLAMASGDEGMIEAYQRGFDMHCDTVARMFDMPYDEVEHLYNAGDADIKRKRTDGKKVGFGLAYGKTAVGLAQDWDCTPQTAQKFINTFFQARPGVERYIRETVRFVKKHGFVQTLVGRFRNLSKIFSDRYGDRSHAERQAINAPIQGTAADIVKQAMIAIDRDPILKELGFELQLQVHDELLGQCPPENEKPVRAIIQDHMENPFPTALPVPLVAKPEVVPTWADLK